MTRLRREWASSADVEFREENKKKKNVGECGRVKKWLQLGKTKGTKKKIVAFSFFHCTMP